MSWLIKQNILVSFHINILVSVQMGAMELYYHINYETKFFNRNNEKIIWPCFAPSSSKIRKQGIKFGYNTYKLKIKPI